MERQTTNDAAATSTRLLAGLNGGRGGAGVSARLDEALRRAAATASGGTEALELDAAVMDALDAAQEPDGVLAHLELDGLDGLLERTAERLRAAGDLPQLELRRRAWRLLDLVRRPAVLRRIDPRERERWSRRLLAVVEASHLTVGPLFRQRAERYGAKPLFEAPAPSGQRMLWSWRETATRVESLASALLGLGEGGDPPRIALLSENRPELARLDLACLTSGIVNVMVPASATETDAGYILRHSGCGVVFAGGPEQLRKALACREALAPPALVVALDAPARGEPSVTTLEALLARGGSPPRPGARERAEAVRISDLATVMYTSGTTGMPKGIRFSHRNIVFKRFARALALPEIGEDDVFLCYLPLFHTFGRYLELLGCIFWGARYCFLTDTSADGLVRGLARSRPTAFISVPKKWIELHERIAARADPVQASDEEVARAVRELTGGRLRWGLSAAGHLDPEIFRFFAANGVELLSGFGMTEATGGITMTEPGDYRDGSLGRALPGIELRQSADGELEVRGPYVMEGYLDPPDGKSGLDPDGWLATGDLVDIDEDGHLRLIDRRKEIYKNLQGQTIAPQRVENHFRDFHSVGRALLIGDHREYSTLLIYPAPGWREPERAASPGELQEHFRSLIVSVNKFLAPYERVVDFAIIDRDLDPERGELTPKGTPRRKVVEQNFAATIRDLYRRASLHVGGVELRIPNWLFQILGITARDIRSDGERITLPASGASLTVRACGESQARVGSCLYRLEGSALSLGTLLTAPSLWLGNEELVDFVPLDTTTRQRQRRPTEDVAWAGRAVPFAPATEARERLARLTGQADLDILDVDLAARMLGSADEADVLGAVDVLAAVLRHEDGPLHDPARWLLERLAETPHRAARRRAFVALVPAVKEPRFREFVGRFLAPDPEILDAPTRDALAEATLPQFKLETFLDVARRACEGPDSAPSCEPLLRFLAAYGAAHPVTYRRLRAFFERAALFNPHAEARRAARRAAEALLRGFRQWLGPSVRIAVDPETGQEYRWEEVVAFESDVAEGDRRRLLEALKATAILREAVFLFSHGALVRLSDIPPGGVWVRLLGSRHGKSVYRVTVQTRHSGSHDLAVNVNHDLSPDAVREELRWLVLCGDPGNRAPLVEDFGGFWPEHNLWSEEFIVGETLDRVLRRLARAADGAERLRRLWPFFAWATLAAYVDFWHRSGKRLEIAGPDMTNIVVPIEDYVSGVRIVSLSKRRRHTGLRAMLRAFRDEFLAPAEREYAVLAGLTGWELVFASVLEVAGEAEGLALLRDALERDPAPEDEFAVRLRSWADGVERDGFVPLRLHFAIERYRRWAQLNADPTPQARARMLQELYETYGLQRLSESYPGIRVRFFLETVFRDGPPELVAGLHELLRAMRARERSAEGLIDAVDALRARHAPVPDADYFLARLSYPFLRPEHAAGFVRSQLGGRRQSEIVVTLEDAEGRPFSVRHALNPREVERLLQLFLAAKLDVRFRIEHRHLVALNERGQIIGGIYYEIDEENRSAHLEKLVVAERYRRKGVAAGLMNEFFNRLRAAELSTVTTGFFRPEYFYSYGFRIEKRYAGLVKSLDEPAAPAAETKPDGP